MHSAAFCAPAAASRIVPNDVSLPIRPTYLSALQGGERLGVAVVRQAVGDGFSIPKGLRAHAASLFRSPAKQVATGSNAK